ncbi:hypothetical protein GCM10027062_07150 [Nocardioides hungaricus]
MTEPAAARQVRVVPAAAGELRVPADVAELLGEDAQLEVGPGQVVTLRPGKLSSAAMAAGTKPLDDASRLRHTRTPLTAQERAALDEFLAS